MTGDDVDSIINSVAPDLERAALQSKRGDLLRMQATFAVDYRLEQDNPFAREEDTTASMKAIKAQLEMVSWGIQKIEARLAELGS